MSAPEVGQRVQAETEQGRVVVVEVTKVDEGAHGWDVWGYRVGTVARRRAGTSYPRRYFVAR